MEATSSKPKRKTSPVSSPKLTFSSPTFLSRLEEKEDLQNLNDRLAVYIDKMRYLEERNSTLAAEITSRKEKERQQASEVKSMYEGELANARQLVDEVCKEKSRIELENSKHFAQINDLQKRLESEQQSSKKASNRNLILERKLNDFEASHATLKSEHENLREQYEKILKENEKLQAVVDSTSHQLEERTLEKVELENRIQTLTEDLDFRRRTHERELLEMKEKVESVETTRVVMETDYKQKYDSFMKDKLQELRDEFEEEADNIKHDVENSYKQKFDDAQNNYKKSREECNHQIVIIRDLKSSLETVKIEKSLLENELNSLKKRIEDVERLHADERDDLTKQLKDKTDEIQDLNCTIDDLHKEYEELMGIKIALDLEINAYRKLLEGEEERLNITPTSTPSRKRRRTESDVPEQPVLSTAKGNVQILECDPNGQFIKINNTGTNEEPLGGWLLRHASDGNEPTEFKFNPRSILKGEATVTIWSASSGIKHKPPTELVMKSCDWAPGTNCVTTLHNSEGDVVAQMTQTSPTELGSRSKSRRKRQDAKNESCVIA